MWYLWKYLDIIRVDCVENSSNIYKITSTTIIRVAISTSRIIPRVVTYTEFSHQRNRAVSFVQISTVVYQGWKRSFSRSKSASHLRRADAPLGRFSIPQIVNNTSPSLREISRLGLALPCEYSRIARGVSEPVYEGTAPGIYYSMGANVIWRRSGRDYRARRLSRA